MDDRSDNGNSGSFLWGVIVGAVALFGAGGLYLSGVFTSPEPAEDAQVVDTGVQDDGAISVETDGTEEVAETEAPTDEVAVAEPEPAPQVTAPVLDQIFVEPDGNTLLSGDAAPGAEVRVLLDGEPVHSFTVDETGQFAEFLSIPFNDSARGLVLETTGSDEPVRSDDYLIAALPEPEPEAPAPEADPAEPPEEQVAEAASSEQEEIQPPAEDIAAAETSETDPSDQQPDRSAPAEPDQQIAVLRSGEDGVELVQPPTVQDQAPDQVALDTIGYSETGDVELSGRVQDGSAVRLYLNNRLVADLAPEDDGKWRGELEGVDPGVYTLRVDEVGSDGTVVSRLETPFKREPIEVLQAAGADDTTDQSAQAEPIRSVTVQEGDTLWAISRDRFGDGVLYVRLFEANRDAIRDPDLIYPGQIFTIPE